MSGEPQGTSVPADGDAALPATGDEAVVPAPTAIMVWGWLKRAGIAGAGGYGLKALMNVVVGLFSRRRRAAGVPALVRHAMLAPDALRFGAFVGSYVGAYDALVSTLRWLRGKDDTTNKVIASLAASVTLLLDEPSQRGSTALYVAIRAGYITARRLVRRGTLPDIWWAPYALFSLVNGPIMWAAFLRPEFLEPSYYRWMLNISNMTHDGLGHAIRERNRALAAGADPASVPLVPCHDGYHVGSCRTAPIVDLAYGFGRSSLMYIPVHTMPLLLFSAGSLVRQPRATLQRLAVSIARSSAFLSLYQALFKSVVCFSRWMTGADYDAAIYTGGMVTAAALVCEKPKRVTELTLYCMHKSLFVCWSYGIARGWLRPVPAGELIMFALAITVCITAANDDLQPAIEATRRQLFGATNFPKSLVSASTKE